MREPLPERVPLTFASPVTCGWLYAVGHEGEFSVWQLSLALDDEAYLAGEDQDVERDLQTGEFTWSEVTTAGPLVELRLCSDYWESSVLESRAVSGGRVSLHVEAAGLGDTGCTFQEHLYVGTLRIDGVKVEGRAIDPIEVTGLFGENPC